MEKKHSNLSNGKPAKKFRVEVEDAEFQEMDFEFPDDDFPEDYTPPEDAEVVVDSVDDSNVNSRWGRPDVLPINPSTDSLIFQQIEIDHYIGLTKESLSGVPDGRVPIMRMFGVNEAGNSICCHVHGFFPYLYVTCPLTFGEEDIVPFKAALNKVMMEDLRGNKEQIKEAVLGVEIVQKESIYYFHGNKKLPFLKITVTLPRLIAAAKRLLGEGKVYVDRIGTPAYEAFESNIDFEVRFMVDYKLVGCCWVELPPGTMAFRKDEEKESRCQIEVDIASHHFVPYEPEGEWSKIAPFRILSFDIECAGRKGIFPDPLKDPVIQIGNNVIRQGEEEPFIKCIFTLNDCAPIVGAKVMSFQSEKEMLEV